MRDHKFRHSDLSPRKPRRPLPSLVLRVALVGIVGVALYAAYLRFWAGSGQPEPQHDSDIIPLALPPQPSDGGTAK